MTTLLFAQFLGIENSMLDTGYWILDTDFLIPGIEYQESSIQYPRS